MQVIIVISYSHVAASRCCYKFNEGPFYSHGLTSLYNLKKYIDVRKMLIECNWEAKSTRGAVS